MASKNTLTVALAFAGRSDPVREMAHSRDAGDCSVDLILGQF